MKRVFINRSRAGNIVLYISLSLLAAFMAIPLFYQVLTAFKPLDELFLFPPRFFVSNPTFKNFADLSSVLGDSYVPFSRYVFNSVVVTVVTTLGHLLVTSYAAYPLSKHTKVRYRNAIFNTIVLALMFSPYVLNVPRFLILSKLRLLDSYLALILPAMASTLGLYLLKSFMEQIPDSLIESAKIDGAGESRILWNIVMPNMKPAWLTLIMLMVKDLFNDANSPTLYIYNEAMKTMPVLMNYVVSSGIVRAGAGAAFSLLLLLPPVVIFIMTQSRVVETMKSAGIKE